MYVKFALTWIRLYRYLIELLTLCSLNSRSPNIMFIKSQFEVWVCQHMGWTKCWSFEKFLEVLQCKLSFFRATAGVIEALKPEQTYNTSTCLLSQTQPCAPYAAGIFRVKVRPVEISYVYNEMPQPHQGSGDILDRTSLNIFKLFKQKLWRLVENNIFVILLERRGCCIKSCTFVLLV